MGLRTTATAVLLLLALAGTAIVDATQTRFRIRSKGLAVAAGAPTTYDLLYNLNTYPLPALPTMGIAGTSITDPTFGTVITRVTDINTEADGRNWGTPSGPNISAWASDNSRFYTVDDNSSSFRFYTFNSTTGAYAFDRDVLFGVEPGFARDTAKPHIVFGAQQPHGQKFQQYNFNTSAWSTVYDLRTDVPALVEFGDTYMTPVYPSTTDNWLVAAYGATQELHMWVTVVKADSPSTRWTFNTRTSVVSQNGGAFTTLLDHNGAAANLNFGIHSISIDRSGVWVKIDISGNEGGSAHTAFFNTTTGRSHEFTDGTWYGHATLGYGVHVNCIADTGSDQPQWLFRDLSQGGIFATYRRLIDPTLIPANAEEFTDHQSWNNARPDVLVPFITGTQRAIATYTLPDPWLPLHDEIAAIPSQDLSENAAYRIAHHRNDGSPEVVTFRDSPRPQVSPDGMWVLFTSNWGLSLGTWGAAPKNQRRDLFLVKLDRP